MGWFVRSVFSWVRSWPVCSGSHIQPLLLLSAGSSGRLSEARLPGRALLLSLLMMSIASCNRSPDESIPGVCRRRQPHVLLRRCEYRSGVQVRCWLPVTLWCHSSAAHGQYSLGLGDVGWTRAITVPAAIIVLGSAVRWRLVMVGADRPVSTPVRQALAGCFRILRRRREERSIAGSRLGRRAVSLLPREAMGSSESHDETRSMGAWPSMSGVRLYTWLLPGRGGRSASFGWCSMAWCSAALTWFMPDMGPSFCIADSAPGGKPASYASHRLCLWPADAASGSGNDGIHHAPRAPS